MGNFKLHFQDFQLIKKIVSSSKIVIFQVSNIVIGRTKKANTDFPLFVLVFSNYY